MKIEIIHNLYPGRSDRDAVAALARKHSYVAAIGYKTCGSDPGFTDIVLCQTQDQIRVYLDNPRYCDAEVIYFNSQLAALRSKWEKTLENITQAQAPPDDSKQPRPRLHLCNLIITAAATTAAVAFFCWLIFAKNVNVLLVAALPGFCVASTCLCRLWFDALRRQRQARLAKSPVICVNNADPVSCDYTEPPRPLSHASTLTNQSA